MFKDSSNKIRRLTRAAMPVTPHRTHIPKHHAGSRTQPAAAGAGMRRALPSPRAWILTFLGAALLLGALSLFGAAPASAQQAAVLSNFHVTAATATSITVAWDGVGPGGFYQIRIENLDPGLGERYRIETEPGFIAWQPSNFTWEPRYTYTGLTTGSAYRLQARSGTGTRYGPWSRPVSVTVGTSAVTPLVSFARVSGELRASVFEGKDSKPDTGQTLCETCGIVLNIAPELSTASTVTVVPRPGTAAAGVDYSTAPYTVEIPASTSTVRIHTPVIDNILSQPLRDVSFFLELKAVDGAPYAIGADRRMEIGPITDDDVVTVSFSPTNLTLVEGAPGSTTVILDKLASYPITVTLTAAADDDDNTANAAAGDYRLLVTEVTIPAGETSVALPNLIQALHDGVTESDEVALVKLTDLSIPPGARAEVGPDPLKVTISNSYKSSLSVSPNPVAEGSSATVTVTLSEAPGSAITLPVTLRAGTAESGDFRVSGVSPGTSIQKNVSLAATATSATFTVSAAQDTDAEDETFTVFASAGAEPVTVTILDDEAGARNLRVLWPWIVPVKLAWNDPTSDPAPAAYDVHYTTDKTVAADAAAVSGTDPAAGWVEATQSGSFVARFEGENSWYTSAVKWGTEYRFRVRARYQLYSGNRRAGIRFSGWTHTSTVIGSHTAVGVVESPPYGGAGYESNGRASLRVRLANPVDHEVKVDYATADDPGATSAATAGTDYTAVSGTVTFAPGETQKSVTVPIIDDDVSDSGETFLFVLSNPQPADKVRLGSYILGFNDVSGPGPIATVTIFNHEADLKALTVEGAPAADGPYTSLDIGAFVPETTEYKVTVPYETTHARLTGTALHDKQKLKAGTGSNLQAVVSGAASAAIPLAVGKNALVVESSLASGDRKTFTVTVTRQQRANNPPTVASAISDATIINESGTHEVSLSGVFADADQDSLTITASSSDENVATVSVSADYSTLTVTAKARGTTTITLNATDGEGGVVVDSFTVSVKSAPEVASAIGDVSDLAVGDTRDISLSGVFSDADGDDLSITASSSGESVAAVAVAADQSGLTVSGVSEGTATITVTAQDSKGNRVSDAFDVTVSAVEEEQQQAAHSGPEPRNVQVVPGDGTITVTWQASPFYYKERLIDSGRIKHALRWWQGSNWANPVGENGIGRNDGIHVESGVTSYIIRNLTNDVAVEVQVRAFFGNNYQEGAMNKGASSTSSGWVKAKSVTPKKPNQSPVVASAIDDMTIVNESRTSEVSLSGVFTDADGDDLTITASSSSESVATVSVSADHSTLTVTAKKRGAATVTATATDDKGGSIEDSFTVKVKAAPVVASAIADVSELTISDTHQVSLSGVFSDADAESLTVMASSSKGAVATVSVAADQSGLTLAGKAPGTATITVTARDSDGNSVSDTFDVTVVMVNSAPTVASAISNATIVKEGGTKQVSLSGVFTDADGDSLKITAKSSGTAIATVSVATDQTSLTVSAQDRGTTTITVTASDGNGGSVEDSFTVTVKAAPAVASAIADIGSLVAGTSQEVALTSVFSDADNDTLALSASSSATAVATVSVATDGSKLTVTGVAEGTAAITVTAQDSDGNSVSDTFDVTVLAANNAPTVASAISDATIVNESGTHQVSLSGVFTDGDGDDLTIRAVSSSTGVATVSVSADYSTLTVTAKKRGTATITVTAKDGNGGSVKDSFTVTVKAAPVVASAIADISELAAEATHEVSMAGVFSDADGDALTISASSSNTAVVQVSNTFDPSTGSATAITVTGVDEGTATVTVTARDTDGNSVSDAFDVTVPVVAEQKQAVELPGPVVSLAVTASAEDSVTVSWSAPDTGGAPQGYIVHIKRKGGGYQDTRRPGADRTTVSFGNLESGRAYDVWVRAQNDAGKGERVSASITLPQSEDPEDTLPAVLPGPVTGLELTADGNALTVSWSAPETGGAPDGYIVHVSPEDGGKGKTKTPKAIKTQVTFKNLDSGRTYVVWVRAENEAGKGERVHASITLPEEEDVHTGQ